MNYSNSQRAGVILNFTAVLFGGYNKIITKHTNARLKKILRKSWKKLDAEGIQNLKYEAGYQTSDDVRCEKNKYIYYVEITRSE